MFFNADGVWAETPRTPTVITGAIQPAKDGEYLIDERNNTRIEIKRILWTRTQIEPNDQITYQNQIFRVLKVYDRQEGLFFKAALGLLK